jgi:isopenicillin-N N-acyltransferase-like protein
MAIVRATGDTGESFAEGTSRSVTSTLTDRMVTVEGGHREMGRQLGEQCRDRIARVLDFLRGELPSRDVQARVEAYLPFVMRQAPLLIEELDGLAEGARIRSWEALLIQVRFELIGYDNVALEGCTSFAIRADDRIITGQNVDTTSELADMGIVLRMRPFDGPEKLMYTYFPGMLGYLGINSAGLTCFGNAVVSPGWKPGFPRYFVLRGVLESETVDEAQAAVKAINRASSINVVLTDRRGTIRDLEIDVERIGVLHDTNGWIGHANHYLSPELREKDLLLRVAPDSGVRQRVIDDRLAQIQAEGHADIERMKDVLRDHEGYPQSVCRHPVPHGITDLERSQTVASLVTDSEAGRMHVAFGPPCCTEYVTFSFN